MPADVVIKLYEQTVRWQHHELLRKNYEINKLKEQVCAYHEELSKVRDGYPCSAYEVLIMLANDPNEPSGLRLRAADAAAQYERPKLTANHNTNITGNIGERLDAARRRIAPKRPMYPVIEGGGPPDDAA